MREGAKERRRENTRQRERVNKPTDKKSKRGCRREREKQKVCA
jgi:hypothetical protein